MILAQVFTGIATPLILGAYLITVLYPHRRRVWSTIATLGAISQLIGGILYSDKAIIILETVFLILNLYAFFTSYPRFNLFIDRVKYKIQRVKK